MKREIWILRRKWVFLVSSLILVYALTGLAQAQDWSVIPSGGTNQSNADYKQGELLVRFVDGGIQLLGGPRTTISVRSDIAGSIVSGAVVTKEYDQIVPGLSLVKLPSGTTVLDAIVRFNQSSYVLYAQPNYIVKLSVIPNDPRFFEQWGLNNIGVPFGRPDADIDAPEAWDINTGSSDVIVAVIDSGIDVNHPDLMDNIWINDGEVNEPGVVDPEVDFNDVDDDGNGYNDDVWGYDFVDDDPDPADEHYHGTHVAGIIGAVGNNMTGIAGVCWTVKLMALRAFDANGVGDTGAIIEATGYATSMGVKVINASYGGYFYSQAEYDAIATAGEAGILFVAAAGNDGSDIDIDAEISDRFQDDAFPAEYDLDNIISVMATNPFDNRASFSNYGLEEVDLGAPGANILSTTPIVDTNWMTTNFISTDYDYASGTSMAAPHVSGACVLVGLVNPFLTTIQIKQIILRSVDPVLPRLCVSGGRLNLYNALYMARQGIVINTRTSRRYPAIQEAIDDALDGDTLVADSDFWYIEAIDFKGKAVTVRSGEVDGGRTFGNPSPQNTFISALFDGGPTVTFNSGEDSNSVLLGFTVTDGIEGIYIEGSSPTVNNCIVTLNTNSGIYCNNSSPELLDCVVTENTTEQNGAGIFCDQDSDPNISGCRIVGNVAEGSGGGIYCNNGSNPHITGSEVSENAAPGNAGGIYCGKNSDVIIVQSIVSDNSALWSGGGIYAVDCAPQISDCKITGNKTAWDGGGVYSDTGSLPTIMNSTISDNIADYDGGGIYCNGTSIPIKNCLIIDNTVVSWDGGGVFCANASPIITNCTFVGNGANLFDGLGGAVYCAGASTPQITNCIFSDNNDVAIYEQETASEPTVNYCLFHNNPRGDYYDRDGNRVYNFMLVAPDSILTGSNNFTGNPMFVPGRLGNYYLSQYDAGQILDADGQFVDPNVNPQDATSPAVDAGSDDAVTLGMHIYSTRTDNFQDEQGNKDFGRVDIGYHYNDPEPAVQFTLTTRIIPADVGTITPDPAGTHVYKQYSQVLLITGPKDPNVYQFKSWDGTDNDARMDMTSTGGIAPIQMNVVTMSGNKTITVRFETILVTLRTRVVGGNGTVSPRGGQYTRGTVVNLTAIPSNPAHYIKWNGSDYDFSYQRENTVTMSEPFMIDPQGREFKEVEVTFYAPRTINVPGDYTNLQIAFDAANNGDIVVINPGVYDLTDSNPPLENEFLLISGRSFTITGVNPDDPATVAATVIQDGGLIIQNVNRGMIINGITIRGAHHSGNNSVHLTYQGYITDTKIYGADVKYFTGSGSGLDGPGGHLGDTYGGAIELRGTFLNSLVPCVTSPDIRNCIFIDCSANGIHGGDGNGGEDALGYGGQGGWGGAGCGGGAYIGANNSPTFTNCTFIDCWARGGDGGDGGDNPNGHGGSWGDPLAPWWWEYGPFEDEWKYGGYGGAVYCADNSSPEFVDCNFINNNSYSGSCGISGGPGQVTGWPYEHYRIDRFGGAVYAKAGSKPVFTRCNFSNNEADVNGPEFWNTGRQTQSDVMNTYDPYLSYGGAIAFEDGVNITFNNCTFNNNLATVGGATWSTWADLNINKSEFVANTAYAGGGVYFLGNSCKITQSNFRENQALIDTSIADPNNPEEVLGEGGAINCFDANATIVDCNVFNNEAATSGGGVYITGSNRAMLQNCLITGNSAGRDGGGISTNWYSESKIINCTITDNIVAGGGFGGGLYSSYSSYVKIINSIIWDNLAGIGAEGSQLAIAGGFKYDQRQSTVDVNYSDIQGATDPNAFGARAEALDLVFCIDTTGSMFDDIDAVQDAAVQITNAISTKFSDYRIAVVDYKDFNQPNLDPAIDTPYGGDDDYPYRTDSVFTTNTDDVIAALNLLTASGGADFPESVYAAVMHCIDHNSLAATLAGQLYGADPNSLGPGPWRSGNVVRVIILMGDAPPHDPEPFTNFTLDDIANAAGGFEAKYIVPVLIGQNPEAATYFEGLANQTGGAVLRAATAADVVQALLDAIDLISLIPNPIFVDTDCSLNWSRDTYSWDPNSHNIDEDPLFVAGYYLSQVAAGQIIDSPAVNAGSDLSSELGLDTYTTRTDSEPDIGVVDMGYHYAFFTIPQYLLTFTATDVNVIEPDIYNPSYTGLYNWYTTVTLRIDSNSYDSSRYQILWSGTDDDSLSGPVNTVLMNRSKIVTARLVQTRYDLAITVDGGNGQLSASWSEDGVTRTIRAPATSLIKFDTVVQLISEPVEGFRVRKWSGTDNDASRSFTNTVTVNSDRTVRVEFGQPTTLTVPQDYATIQNAITAAQVGDVIVVYGGTYSGNINLQGKKITLVSANPDDPNVVAITIIDCNENGRGFIFDNGEDADTVVDGFTIINGNLAGADGGAGIYISSNSSPTIMNTVISNCNAEGDPNDPNSQSFGGGIYVNNNCSPKFINCTITDCTADVGGGVFSNLDSSPTFWHCTFSNNSADTGGGLFGESDSSITIVDCNFANNSASYGGGIFSEPNSLVTINEGMFTGNTATDSGGAMFWLGMMEIFDCNFVNNSALSGGGLFCSYSAETTVVGCTLSQNRAGLIFDPNDPNAPTDGRGGGIFFFGTPALVSDCIISQNVANASGGAVYLAGSSNSTQISNCLITNNLAGRDGGGISVNWYAEPLISNCTIAGNAASGTFGELNNTSMGGGLSVYYGSDTEVINSIFWNNNALKGKEIVIGTGFEFDRRPSTLTVSYSDVMGGKSGVRVESGCTLRWLAGNISADPLFVTGLRSDYYLSQTAAGQSRNSPCVDAGSDLAGHIGLARYTTRTDEGPDKGIVDLGYHFTTTAEPCSFCNFFNRAPNGLPDGIINFKDFAIFASHWLQAGCSEGNDWCLGADLTLDSSVDIYDLAFFVDCWLAQDTTAPAPNPSVWEIEPNLTPPTSVRMAAKESLDGWGWNIQYYFERLPSGDPNSGWQSSREWVDGGLELGVRYGYRVKARDELGNETGWSDIAYAGTDDVTPPAPAPYILPVQDVNITPTSITVTSSLAYDESGVEYSFRNITAGHESGWISEPNFIDTDLRGSTTYGYQVKARDLSARHNDTPWSPTVYITTLPAPDTDPPEPNPMQFDPNNLPREIFGGADELTDYYATMTAEIATDDSGGIEYFFECQELPILNSGWQADNDYTVRVGRGNQSLRFRVKARDVWNNDTIPSPWYQMRLSSSQ